MSSFKKRYHRFVTQKGFQIIQRIERFIGARSLVGDRPFFDPDRFAWTQRLETHTDVIQGELGRVLQHRDHLPNFQDISEDQRAITRDDRWKTFFLYGFGYKAETNCTLCPETTRLVEGVPGMTTAFFSILAPGKHIPAHRGPYKGVLRYHLGLKIPEPASQCRIRVGDEVRHWTEGESLLFDDTYDHEVWNDTDGERAILFMDVERPLPEPWASFNRAVIWLVGKTPFVQEAKKNQEAWEEKLTTALPAPHASPPL
jgi:beta-hydroxylase